MHLHGLQASLLRQVHSLPTVGITLTQLVPMLQQLDTHKVCCSGMILLPTSCWQIPLEERNIVLALIDDIINYIEHM